MISRADSRANFLDHSHDCDRAHKGWIERCVSAARRVRVGATSVRTNRAGIRTGLVGGETPTRGEMGQHQERLV